MTLKLIQQRSRELRARTRRKLLGTLGAPLVVGFLYFFILRQFPTLAERLQLPLAFALVWSLAGQYFLNRGMWSVMTLGEVGISTGLQACRREIERQRDLVRRGLLWSVGPMLLAIGTFIVGLAAAAGGQGLVPRGVPFLVLVGVWIVAFFVIRFREQQGLQREIEELDEIEREGCG